LNRSKALKSLASVRAMTNPGGGEELHFASFLAGTQTQSNGEMSFTGATVALSKHILPFLDILTSRQFHNQPFVKAGNRFEVKAVEGLVHRKAGFRDSSFDRLLLALDQFQLGQLQQEPNGVVLLFGTLGGHLLVLTVKDR